MNKSKLAYLSMLLLFIASCSGKSSGPTAPSTPVTPPAPTTFTLSGAVTSTTGTPLNGATIRIGDGVNAGRSTTAASNGSYSLTGLSLSGFTATASATNYVALGKAVTLTSSQTI